MILVDTSVWIAHLQNRVTVEVHKLREIDQPNDILVGDLILLEVLQGARSDAHAAQIETLLRQFEVARMLDDELAVQAASYYRVLRGQGITIRKTIDVIIAGFCIRHEHILLHDDRDFHPFAAHLGLRCLYAYASRPAAWASIV